MNSVHHRERTPISAMNIPYPAGGHQACTSAEEGNRSSSPIVHRPREKRGGVDQSYGAEYGERIFLPFDDFPVVSPTFWIGGLFNFRRQRLGIIEVMPRSEPMPTH